MFESHYLDITVLAVYLLLCLCIGLYKAFSVKTLKTFAIGNGNLPSSILVLTIFCTAFGAGAIIGYSENIYISGTLYICCMLFTPLFWLITAWIFVQNIERFFECQIFYRPMFIILSYINFLRYHFQMNCF